MVELKKGGEQVMGKGTIPIMTKSDKKLMRWKRRKEGDEEKLKREEEIYKKSRRKRHEDRRLGETADEN